MITKGDDVSFQVFKGTSSTPEKIFPFASEDDEADGMERKKARAFEKAIKLAKLIMADRDTAPAQETIMFDSSKHKL